MPTVPSYLFEIFVLNFLESKDSISEFIDVNMINFWDYLTTAVYNNVKDPKGFQADLNTLSYDERQKISAKSDEANRKGYEAYKAETEEKDQRTAINKWREIFGNSFPSYG